LPLQPDESDSIERALHGYHYPIEVVPRGRAPQVPEAVRQEIARLKGLYAGFHYRELARILFATLHYRIDHKTEFIPLSF
jgi:hypothetical protein